jgi:hypothetical protein
MSPTISKRAAQIALGILEEWPGGKFTHGSAQYAIRHLKEALKPKRPGVRARATRKRRASRKEETQAIREQVFARAFSLGKNVPVCELCRGNYAAELHHALGRVKVRQSQANCLALCRRCHREVTDSVPTAEAVLEAQALVFDELGFAGTAIELRKRARFADAKASLPAAPEVSR